MRTRTTRTDFLDQTGLKHYTRSPELGPRIVFFSGGTALRETSRALIRYTHNSIHLITPFDSGGSSAVLRQAFAMPAVGDIRNRLMALADRSIQGAQEIFELFAHRLPKESTQGQLRNELASMADGSHSLIRSIPPPMYDRIRGHLARFQDAMPEGFDLKGASIGNLVLTAGYLSNQRHLTPAIATFSELVQVHGEVLPTLNKNLHMAVRLENGRTVVGQHLMTGKEAGELESPVCDFWLTDSLESDVPVKAAISDRVRERIAAADLICYPLGSFYSSVLANLLPDGVGAAVADNPCPKVFVPNTVRDPEVMGLSVAEQARILCHTLNRSGAPANSGLDCVVVDPANGEYPGTIDKAGMERLGLQVIESPLISADSKPLVDGQRLGKLLLSMA